MPEPAPSAGDVDLSELCTFLMERRDEMNREKDEQWMLEACFSGYVWGSNGVEGEGTVGVRELREVFMRDCKPNKGLSEAEFAGLLAELGLDPSSAERIPLVNLQMHPAFGMQEMASSPGPL